MKVEMCLFQDDKGEPVFPRGLNATRQVLEHSSIPGVLTVTMATVPMATEWETTECLD